MSGMYTGRHRDSRAARGRRLRVLAAAAAAAASAVTATGAPVPAHASTQNLGARVLDKAETQAGCWYSYGHTGPCSHGYDCSGLVYWAARQIGLGSGFPRDTFSMLGSVRLVRIPLSSARRGDLMFFGSGHVEIKTIWYHGTFGAQETGTRVGWHRWSSWWHPTMAYRIAW